ncbi:interleukin-21 receptor [Betta splendens]|uniref:Interleukin-21 receptor n=1 Tax=Betta splendens TaxID=158456 RepID=A0A6P7L7B4_BETSP|nr:interleukin-21 receptor [Betta splendens]
MGRRPAPLCLLVSISVVCLRGDSATGDHGLQCVTDYLLINCSLNLSPSENTSYWLRLLEKSVDGTVLLCPLANASGRSSCSTGRSAEHEPKLLMDMYSFEVSLCHGRRGAAEACEVLEERFQPAFNIKPKAPCCLEVTRNASRHRFAWRSTYEQYSRFTNLVNSFTYELHLYRGAARDASHNITTAQTEYSVDDRVLALDGGYAAKVRSSPNQVFYEGQWSEWSDEVRWRTEDGPSTDAPVVSLAKWLFIPLWMLCVLALLVLLMCHAPLGKWKESVFIPNPAPYFHTLYNNFQGDFRSWVVTQGNTADMLPAEETLRIDTLIKSPDAQEDERQAQGSHQLMPGSGYSNITGHMCEASLPYTVSSTAPLSEPESSPEDAGVSAQSGNPAEGDSGCWLCSNTSLEKEPAWYCNDYCTLSAFQQLTLGPKEHLGGAVHPRDYPGERLEGSVNVAVNSRSRIKPEVE